MSRPGTRKRRKVKRRVPVRLLVSIPGSALAAPVAIKAHPGTILSTVPLAFEDAYNAARVATFDQIAPNSAHGTYRLRKRPRRPSER